MLNDMNQCCLSRSLSIRRSTYWFTLSNFNCLSFFIFFYLIHSLFLSLFLPFFSFPLSVAVNVNSLNRFTPALRVSSTFCNMVCVCCFFGSIRCESEKRTQTKADGATEKNSEVEEEEAEAEQKVAWKKLKEINEKNFYVWFGFFRFGLLQIFLFSHSTFSHLLQTFFHNLRYVCRFI